MNAKSRKPLNDSLAEQFVFGETTAEASSRSPVESPVEESGNPSPPPSVSKMRDESEATGARLMEKLKSERREPTIRLTVDLVESTHRKLSVLAARTGRKKVEIVRLLLDDALKEVE
jgi:hypothetical protein